MVDETQRQRSFSPGMRRMGRQEGNTPIRDPIDMAPDFRAGPYRPLPITPNYERPTPNPLPIPPGYERGPYRPLPLPPINPGRGPMPPFSPKQFEDYFNRGMRRGIDSLTPSNIGFDRMGGPDRALPGDILHMLENPENYRGMEDLRELEEQMDPDNYFTNRLAVGEQFGVDPFGDPGSTEAPYREGAAVDPSDWRNILRILEAGGDPQTETAGIMGAMPQERQMAELTDDQRNFMRNRYFSPDLPGAPTQDELFRRVKEREKKPLFGIFGGQEPTTRDEFDEYYNYLLKGDSSNQPFYVT